MAVTLKDLLEAGCHFGHQSRRWNPKMKQYIFTEREGVHVFDLVKTKEGLEAACEYLKELSANGGTVVMVGTKRQAANLIKDAAKKVNMPFVSERWLGGTFTNFEQFKKRLNRLSSLKSQKESGELKSYTKKEQLLFDREIAKLERFFGGMSGVAKIPEAIFVVDARKEDTAIREAKRVGAKVVAIVDSNSNPEGVDYVIPANDDAVKSISLIIDEVTSALSSGKGTDKESAKAEETDEKKTKKKAEKSVVKEIKDTKDEPEEV
jgi:small subunit ribosomal protein S2